MSLSFRITSRSTSMAPALFSASNAMPAVIAPSPITAIARRVLALQLRRRPPCRARAESRCRNAPCRRCRIAFLAAREARDAAPHAQPLHRLAPAGEDLVPVGLVAHVPHEAVVGRVEHVVQRDRELDRAEVRRQVAAGLRHRSSRNCAQLVGELRAAGCARARAARRVVDGLQQLVHRRIVAVCGKLAGDRGHPRTCAAR